MPVSKKPARTHLLSPKKRSSPVLEQFTNSLPGFALGLLAAVVTGALTFMSSFARLEARFDAMQARSDRIELKLDNLVMSIVKEKK